jgi:hypothetical protein
LSKLEKEKVASTSACKIYAELLISKIFA